MVFHDFPCVFKIRTCTNCDRGRIFEAPGREGTKKHAFRLDENEKKEKTSAAPRREPRNKTTGSGPPRVPQATGPKMIKISVWLR